METQIRGVCRAGGYIQVEMEAAETPQTVQSRLLIGADGNRSTVKSLSHITTHGFSHNQMGLVCTLKAAPSSSPVVTSYQKFMSRSIVALLPLFGDHYSLVWSL